jgi:hypothetical protein
MAYRAIFNRETLQALNQPTINKIIDAQVATAWFGPGGHVVLYPVSQGQNYNMVLIRPDDLPEGVKTDAGVVEELKEIYKGWDPASVTPYIRPEIEANSISLDCLPLYHASKARSSGSFYITKSSKAG